MTDKEEHARLTKPVPPVKPYVQYGLPTRAEWATVVKASQEGGVRMQGGYGGKPPKPNRRKKGDKAPAVQPVQVTQYRSMFATKLMVERCWGKRWVWPDENAANVYRATEAGKAAVQAYNDYADARESYKADKAAWEAQNAPKKAKPKAEAAAHA